MAVIELTAIRILEILLVPYYYRFVIWTVAPLIFALLMLEMYFGKYKTEQLGWNTAFANTISLMWVTVILFKYAHERYEIMNFVTNPFLRGYFIMVIVLALLTLILAVLNFQHKMPKKFAFLISSSLPINGLAYFITVIIMGHVPLDRITFFAVVVIFVFLAGIFNLYRKSITPAKSAIPTLKKHEEKAQKELKKKERKAKIIFAKEREQIRYFWNKYILRRRVRKRKVTLKSLEKNHKKKRKVILRDLEKDHKKR